MLGGGLSRLVGTVRRAVTNKHSDGPPAPPPPGQQPRQVPPPIYPLGYEEDEQTSTAKARSIARCSDLLRQKYELDIKISTCGAGEESKRRQLQRKSDAIFREVCKSVDHWRSSSRIKWTREEWNQLKEVFRIVDEQVRARNYA